MQSLAKRKRKGVIETGESDRFAASEFCGMFHGAPQPVVLPEFCLASGLVVEGMFECWSS